MTHQTPPQPATPSSNGPSEWFRCSCGKFRHRYWSCHSTSFLGTGSEIIMLELLKDDPSGWGLTQENAILYQLMNWQRPATNKLDYKGLISATKLELNESLQIVEIQLTSAQHSSGDLNAFDTELNNQLKEEESDADRVARNISDIPSVSENVFNGLCFPRNFTKKKLLPKRHVDSSDSNTTQIRWRTWIPSNKIRSKNLEVTSMTIHRHVRKWRGKEDFICNSIVQKSDFFPCLYITDFCGTCSLKYSCVWSRSTNLHYIPPKDEENCYSRPAYMALQTFLL